eukprot:13593540-Ditylum_brightwellii.AAC.1
MAECCKHYHSNANLTKGIMKQYNVTTMEVTSKIATILQEMKLVTRLILGTVVAFVRKSKTIALWARFPPK